MAHSKTLLMRVAICLILIANLTLAQTATRVVVRPDYSQILPDCEKLDALKNEIPKGEAGELLKHASAACQDYSRGKLTKEQWSDRILSLDEHAAFVKPPAAFVGIIPFHNTEVFHGYETYSLFLFPSEDWKHKKDEVRQLYQEFSAFGDAIGDKRLALWFSEKNDDVDIRRSKLYCDLFGLDYNDGPFVVTLQKSPAEWVKGDPAVTLSLSGISPQRKLKLLNVLERDLRTSRDVKQRPLLFAEIRERLMSIAEQHKGDLEDIAVKVFDIH